VTGHWRCAIDAQEFVPPAGLLLIDGKQTEGLRRGRFDVIDPATEAVAGTAADGTAQDMAAAVAAARKAFDRTRWSTDHGFRRRCLDELHDALLANLETLRAQFVTETGSPVTLTRGSGIDLIVDQIPYWAALAESYKYETDLPAVEAGGVQTRRLLRREPFGVVGVITPWNSPVLLALRKICSALAAGCTVVLKPAPDTPWAGGTELGRIIAGHTSIPPGVVNVVASADHAVGEALVGDPRVDMVSFTGSTATGRRVGALAASTVKRVCLELGGKSANVVLDDADLAAVVSGAVSGVCRHSGQGCAYLTRLLLPRGRYAEGLEIAVEAARHVTVGNPWDPAVLQGPVISARQRERVLGYIETGKSEARLVTGGGRPRDLPTGYYVEPTIFADVDPGAVIAQEEIFGPVLCVIPYDSEDQAVEIANSTIYGLAAAVHSKDHDRAMAVARRLRAGNVDVNGRTWWAADSPFGGYRQSGLGREGGLPGLEEHLEIKLVSSD
jgi:aldehyde dehydrogenase (NAD+)